MKKDSGWYYAGRFVFSGQSQGNININLTGINTQTQLYFYSDQNVDWPKVYSNKDSCQLMTNPTSFTQSISIPFGQISRQKLRQPEFWYVAIANCNGNIQVKGYIHFEDQYKDTTVPSYDKEFDYSQQFETEIFSILAMSYCAMFSYQMFNFFVNLEPKRHIFQYLVAVCIFCMSIGLIAQLGWDTQYSRTGDSIFLTIISQICVTTGSSLLVSIILLMGQGWLISNEQLQYKWLTIIIIVVQSMANFALMVYNIMMQNYDPVYAYSLDSPIGIIYNICMLGLSLWFMVSCMITRKKEVFPERKALYLSMFIIFSSSLLSSPVGWLFALILPKWFRFIFTLVMIKGIDLVSIIVIIYVTSYRQVQQNFSVNINQNQTEMKAKLAISQQIHKNEGSDDLGGW
eukprot:EST46545.1 Rhodopsin-like GPCR transmembrane domain-containing protein [Spironucleus salmonicida]